MIRTVRTDPLSRRNCGLVLDRRNWPIVAGPRDGGFERPDFAKLANHRAIAIGHPLGASGARIMTTMVNALNNAAAGTRCRRCVRAAAWPTPRSSSDWTSCTDHGRW